jgi:hypothetical protein
MTMREDARREKIENNLMDLIGAQITYEELGEIFDQARRYRALYRFVEETDVGSITASAVYPELSEGDDDDDDEAPPAPEHLKAQGGDLICAYGLGLDALADFLDANRKAGKFADPQEYKRREPRDLSEFTRQPTRKLAPSEQRSAKLSEDL